MATNNQITLGPAYNDFGYDKHAAINNLVPSQHPIIDNNVKILYYYEHPVTTSTFSYIKVLVVSRTQCKWNFWKFHEISI